jgi:DNA polymerase-1
MSQQAHRLVDSTSILESELSNLAQSRLLAVELISDGQDPHSNQPVILAIGNDDFQLLIDCRKVSLLPLTPLLTGKCIKIFYRGAKQIAMLRSLGIRLENAVDTMLIEQVLESRRGSSSYSLSELADKYIGLTLDGGRPKVLPTAEFADSVLEKIRRRLTANYLVFLDQLTRLNSDDLEHTARLECETLLAFADLFFDGIYLDKEAWQVLVDEAAAKQNQLRSEIDPYFISVSQTDLFGHLDLNYESDTSLKEALSKLLASPIRDVSKQTLKRINHPVAKLLLSYREAAKIVSTYGESFLGYIHPKTKRIHADFQQIGAPTGRVACARPNLQSVPRGSRFRKCFVASAGRKMVTADYAGCELRILAEVSQDPAFIRTFRRGGDLHSIVASEIFSTTVSKSRNPHLRERAKAINFGLAYGMGAGGLASVTNMTVEEAEKILRSYFQAYPQVKAYLENSALEAIKRGYAKTIGGRRLYLQIQDEPGPARAGVVRVAKNMPIQGTNADMLKVAMTSIRRRLIKENLDGLIVNCVHDEILVEVAESDAWEVSEVVKEEMIKAGERYIKQVPILVDVSVSDTWQK